MKKRIALLVSFASVLLASNVWASENESENHNDTPKVEETKNTQGLAGEFQGNFRDHLVVTKCGSDIERHKGYLDLNDDGTWALYDESRSEHASVDDNDQDAAENENEDANDDGLDNDDDATDDHLPILTGTFNKEKNRGSIKLTVDDVAKDAFSNDLEDATSAECDGVAVTTSIAEKSKLRIVVNKRGDRVRFEQKQAFGYVDAEGETHRAKYRSKATLKKL
jgi:hypothetical protein